jgi:hypothetical protein
MTSDRRYKRRVIVCGGDAALAAEALALPIGAIGDVATLPYYQKRGLVRHNLRRCNPHNQKRGLAGYNQHVYWSFAKVARSPVQATVTEDRAT